MNIEQLNQEFAIADQLSIIEGKGGFPVITIDNEQAKANISVYAAQVLSFRPTSADADLMFVSENAYYQTGKATKGGIPICWPWFGPDPAGQGRASHGFVRNRMWTLLSTETTATGETKVRLGVSADEETQKIWPHSFELVMEILVGQTLTVALITSNTGDRAFQITQAFHSYFTVGDINQVKVLGLEETTYLDKVDDGKEKKQSGAITFSSETDRIYTDVKPELTVEDSALNRRIRISATGSKTAIVWNPWKEISAKMGDLEEQDYSRFVCVETANAADDVVEVKPNSTYRLQAIYAIEAIDG
ncbi:D-hexose-6-phosphate mutarotase [cf. Phormidesmis sp. LEGE 11477]|uniref:D-hexose-6-phosphate mutarotase n=1 Tax=cf. Phormidesmis sp. LEGE 11477 TaxID=1828680 RepID=UPI00188009BC|nr:D-hexose-6-phosphate mutarotase [cf. Phormidesmis sp. LEGE 11477]MBE9061098.1 D-hexose-6-phosphate mutarotase [cf. Phormidesmis sp. LEGE 11477]